MTKHGCFDPAIPSLEIIQGFARWAPAGRIYLDRQEIVSISRRWFIYTEVLGLFERGSQEEPGGTGVGGSEAGKGMLPIKDDPAGSWAQSCGGRGAPGSSTEQGADFPLDWRVSCNTDSSPISVA